MINENEVKLRKATDSDVYDIYKIIQNRCKWLDEKSIEQWNVTRTYKHDYYLEKIKDGKIYVAVYNEKIVGVFMFQLSSHYAEYDENIAYIHHLATDIHYKGMGKIIISKIIELAKNHSKKYVRLDNISSNSKLNEYYEKNGFKQIGTIETKNYDGKNSGIIRQLEIL